MNLGELRTEVYRMTGSSDVYPGMFSDAEITRALNEAYQEFARESGALEQRYRLQTSQGTAEYDLPITTGPLRRVAFDDYRLIAFSPIEFDTQSDYWRTTQGDVTHYHSDRLNPKTIRVYKIPDADGGGGTFTAEAGRITYVSGGEGFSFVHDTALASTAWATSTAYKVTDRVANDGVEYRCILAHTSAAGDEPGTGASWETYWVDAKDDGRIVRGVSSGRAHTFSAEDGRVTEVMWDTDTLSIWSKRVPPRLVNDTDTPETPGYSHIGLCYGAARRLLLKRGEARNVKAAKLYGVFETEALEFLRTKVDCRLPEGPVIVGEMMDGGRPVRDPFFGHDDVAPIPYT